MRKLATSSSSDKTESERERTNEEKKSFRLAVDYHLDVRRCDMMSALCVVCVCVFGVQVTGSAHGLF